MPFHTESTENLLLLIISHRKHRKHRKDYPRRKQYSTQKAQKRLSSQRILLFHTESTEITEKFSHYPLDSFCYFCGTKSPA